MKSKVISMLRLIGVGNTTDRNFESLKSIRAKRIRDTFESPKFESISSKQSTNTMSFAAANSKRGSRGPFLAAKQRKISKIMLIANNMFKRRSDMFSFNGENMSSIKSFLSSKKSSSSLGEDLGASK